jgi:hypothetical protein
MVEADEDPSTGVPNPTSSRLSAEQLAEFRREFRAQYGLDGDFAEAFCRWGQAGGPERIHRSDTTELDVLGYVRRHAGPDGIKAIQEAIGQRSLDAEEVAVRKALTTVLEAIGVALETLRPHLEPRQMRTNPDPATALLIARAVLERVPYLPQDRKGGRPSKDLRNRVVAIMANLRYPPAKISNFLRSVGYSELESSEANIAATIQKLERQGQSIPLSPTARNRNREKHRKPV